MKDAVTVRVAELNDLPAILRIYSQPAVDSGEMLPDDAAKALYEKIRQYPSYHLYVACIGPDVVGTFALLIMDNLGHLGRPSAVVEDVAVDPRLQRRGVGRTMINFAIDRAREARCYKLPLSAAAHRHEAHRFYESLGFERHGFSFGISLDEFGGAI
jgi:GNAT superfamily N-acetyltransferase